MRKIGLCETCFGGGVGSDVGDGDDMIGGKDGFGGDVMGGADAVVGEPVIGS